MSIYQALNCQEDVGNADILSGSYTLVDSLERLRAMPMESLPRCDYSLDFDDAGELDSEEVTKSICSSDVISRLSELCSLEPESLPNGGYNEPPIFPCMYSLCNQASECLSDGRFREKGGVPVPKLLLPVEIPRRKLTSLPILPMVSESVRSLAILCLLRISLCTTLNGSYSKTACAFTANHAG